MAAEPVLVAPSLTTFRRAQHPAEVEFAEGAEHNDGMNVIAIVFGVLAILIVLLTGIFPVIGAIFAWVALSIGVVGLVFGLLSRHTGGRNISIVACALAVSRLALGGLFI